MIDPDRVGQFVCRPGDRVRVELGFLWNSEPRMVAASFRKPVGSRHSARRALGEKITLEGGVSSHRESAGRGRPPAGVA